MKGKNNIDKKKIINKSAPKNNNVFEKLNNLKAIQVYLILLIILILLYGKTIFFDFVDLDDRGTIVENSVFFSQIKNFFIGFKESYWISFYRPLLFGSFVLEFQLSGINPFLYHLDNVLLHFISCCLFYRLLLDLQIEKKVALICSVLFIVHPLFNQAVAWVPGRNDTMLAIISVTHFLLYIHYVKYKSTRYLIGYIISFLFALFIKETAIVLPIICIIYYYFNGQKKAYFISIPIKITLVLSWLIIILIWWYADKQAIYFKSLQEKNVASLLKNEIVGIQAFILNIPYLFESIFKIILPIKLSVYPTFNKINQILGGFFYIILIYIIYKNKHIFKPLLLGVLWWFLFLVPPMILFFKDGRYDYLEHRIYVPAIGFFIFVAYLLQQIKIEKIKNILILIIVILGSLSFINLNNYKNKEQFWLAAIKTSPQKINPPKVLSMYYDQIGEYDKSFDMFKIQYSIAPTDITVINYLSVFYIKQKNLDSARYYFKKGFLSQPNNYELNNNYANFLSELKLNDSAIIYFKKAINIDSTHFEPNYFLANIYANINNNTLAEMYYKKVLKIKKDETNSLIRLGVILGNNKNFKEAEENWVLALQKDSSLTDPYNYLIKLYVFQNRIPEAKNLYNQANKNQVKLSGEIEGMTILR